MIREFQRRLHHYMGDVPDEHELDEWMALMQHHGAPTRLLDFTYSPYVAAYFAFEAAEFNSELAIWAVNTDWCEKRLKDHHRILAAHYLSYQQQWTPQAFKAIFMQRPFTKLMLSVTPRLLNERLASQRGTFSCQGDMTVGFTENLSEFTGGDCLDRKVIEYVIPTGDRGQTRDCALKQLDDMNINRITLFPGLDGFAESFQSRIPFFRDQRWPLY